jgi:hypothetical protein
VESARQTHTSGSRLTSDRGQAGEPNLAVELASVVVLACDHQRSALEPLYVRC